MSNKMSAAERARLPENCQKPDARPVYVASPFAGDMEYNAAKARGYCRFAVSRGRIPLAPHLLYPQFMDDTDPEQRAEGLGFGLALLEACGELWVFGGRISEGMAAEIARAKQLRMVIRYFSDKCEEV
jgi:hypothetical protein